MTAQSFILLKEGVHISAALSFFLALLYGSAIYSFYIGKIVQAKNYTFFISNVVLFFGSSLYGRESYNYLSFIPMFIAVIFIYNYEEKKSMIFVLVMTMLNLVVLELTNYSLFIALSDGHITTDFNKWMVLGISITFGFVMLYEMKRINRHMGNKLKRWNANLVLRNEKLKRSNDDLDSFVYRVSHDLRSPLASIMGIIDIVKTEKNVSKVLEYMKYQEQSVKKLDNLIQDVLDVSRNNNLEVVIESIQLKKSLQSCVDSISYLENFSKIKVIIDVPENLVLYSDSRRLNFIVNNLISNSIRYFDVAKAESYLIICTEKQSNDEIVLLFDDNGIGIEEEHIEKVFDMFYRGTATVAGSGLGLFIVKDSVEKINGSITLHSDFGKGTRFLVRIPNARNQFSN